MKNILYVFLGIVLLLLAIQSLIVVIKVAVILLPIVVIWVGVVSLLRYIKSNNTSLNKRRIINVNEYHNKIDYKERNKK